MTEDWTRPSMAPWAYKPDPPFQVLYADRLGQALAIRNFATIETAIDGFVRFHMGPMAEHSACVIDANRVMLVGYHADGDVTWYGVGYGFDQFAKRYDAASVAIWEVMARGDYDPSTPEEGVVP